MRLLRSALVSWVVLVGCAPEDECFKARSAAESECAVVDGTSQWTVSPTEPIVDLERLCAASCIDVPRVPVLVTGYSDLRQAPLVAKFRDVNNLRIDVAELVDLQGLEQVNVTDLLTIQHGGAEKAPLRTLDGLGDREITTLLFRGWVGLESFDASRFDRLENFSSENTNFQRLDCSARELVTISVLGDMELTSVSIGGGAMKQFSLTAASSLTELAWKPGLTVQNYGISQNQKLSSCVVQRFIDETDPGGWRGGIAAGNGPCP